MKFKLVLSIIILYSSTLSAQSQKIITLKETKKLYDSLYLTSVIDSINWQGNVQKCDCGKLEKEIYQKAENRINFFRLINGLGKVKINPKFNEQAQCAALIAKANNRLTHYPTKDMACYSEVGDKGSQKSCLTLTNYKYFGESSFVTAFIKDYGSSNNAVGHRRWLFYSNLESFGYGATNQSEAILTGDGVSKEGIEGQPEFIAYPWNGHVPYQLIFNKWSFSVPEAFGADFSGSSVILEDELGNKIPTMKLLERKNFLDPTIVWTVPQFMSEEEEMHGKNKIKQRGFLDKKILVRISRVKIAGKFKDYAYYVVPTEM